MSASESWCVLPEEGERFVGPGSDVGPTARVRLRVRRVQVSYGLASSAQGRESAA